MIDDEIVRAAADALKVFPLPSAVVFPGTALPLHIFEPRYRAMVEDSLATDRIIAMADLSPGWEQNYAGRPPLRPIGCVGRVVFEEVLPDGRYNIILQGTVRFRVLEELAPRALYREVRAELLEDPPYDGPMEEMVRQAVLEIAAHVSHGAADNLVQLAVKARGGALADLVASALVSDVSSRQDVLSCLDPAERLQRVLSEVSELIARVGAAAPRGPMN